MSQSTDSPSKEPKGSFLRSFGFLLLVIVLTIVAFLGADLWFGELFAHIWFKGSHDYWYLGWFAPLILVLISVFTWRARARKLSREYDEATRESEGVQLDARADKE